MFSLKLLRTSVQASQTLHRHQNQDVFVGRPRICLFFIDNHIKHHKVTTLFSKFTVKQTLRATLTRQKQEMIRGSARTSRYSRTYSHERVKAPVPSRRRKSWFRTLTVKWSRTLRGDVWRLQGVARPAAPVWFSTASGWASSLTTRWRQIFTVFSK